MKKNILLIAIVFSIVLASCSSYTCPTYSKVDLGSKTITKHQL